MRADQWATYVSVDGRPIPAPGVSWDTTAGGDLDSDEVKYRPGGMAPQISLGGAQTLANITVAKILTEATDWAILKGLLGRQGKAPMVVTRQPLDTDGNPFGAPMVYSGTLKTIMAPEQNSESNNAGLWTLVQTTDSVA